VLGSLADSLASDAIEVIVVQGCVHWKSILKEPLLKEPVSNTNVWANRLLEKRLFENRFPVNAALYY